MLFRVVRPMRREGSRNRYFVRRIPSDVRSKAVGLRLTVPLGDGGVQTIIITSKSQAVRLSLGTDDPLKVKARNVAVDAYFERVWQALRDDTPIKLTNEQATALAGRLYRSWARGEGRERTLAVEQVPGTKKTCLVDYDPRDDAVVFEATLQRLVRAETIGKHEMNKPPPARTSPYDLDNPPLANDEPDPSDLEPHFGPLMSRLLLAEGIGRVNSTSRALLLIAFWRALRDALKSPPPERSRRLYA